MIAVTRNKPAKVVAQVAALALLLAQPIPAWVATAAAASPQQKTEFEPAPSLRAGELVGAGLLKGPQHRVSDTVQVEGFLGQFDLQSDHGRFRVRGADILAIRVGELKAIEALNKVSQDDAFKSAVAKSVTNVGTFVAGAVTDPGKTVESIGTGIGTVFGRIGHLAQTGVERVADTADDATSSKGKPTGKAAPAGEAAPPSFTGDPLGYNKARREWAKKLNIDPYTFNPVLRAKLDEAATATFAGNFAIDLVTTAVAGPAQYAIEMDTTVRDAVWNFPAIDLEKQNREKLKAMGIDGRPARDLFRNKWVTPSLQTALVAALERLPTAAGREAVVAAAAIAQGEARVRVLLGGVQMLGEHHRTGEPVVRISTNGVVPVGTTASGATVVAAHVDYVYWNEQVREFAGRKELAKGKKILLLVSGKVTNRAKQELANRGWTVRESASRARG